MTINLKGQRPQKRTKIVATLGPASDSEEILRQMILAGLDVVRINFSHSKPDYIRPVLERIQKLREELKVPLAVMGDLRGPRIRVGPMEGGSVVIKTGQKLTLTPEPVIGNSQRVSVSFARLSEDVQVGSLVLVDDGNIELEVEKIEAGGDIHCHVLQGDVLSSHRGINLPGLPVSLPSITEKDFADVDFAIEHKFDFLALSFVQSAKDVQQLKDYLAEKKADIPVIAKIERKNALDNIEAIARESYGVMVARGDLALEMSIQDVPIAQKRIITICRQSATPVITATQMLESMIEAHKPTRAEATDVANAILDGTDAVMLSGETAIGKNPVEAVAIMATIAARTERAWLGEELQCPPTLPPPQEIEPMVAYAAHVAVQSLAVKTIIPYTASGATARRVASYRPAVPILALSPFPETQRRLALSWGVECVLTEIIQDTDSMTRVAMQQAQQSGRAKPNDTIAIIAGTPPLGIPGHTNTLKVERIPAEGENG